MSRPDAPKFSLLGYGFKKHIIMPWTANDHVFWSKETGDIYGGTIQHLDLQSGVFKETSVQGTILAYSSSLVLLSNKSGLQLISVPSFKIQSRAPPLQELPIRGLLYDMHVAVFSNRSLFFFDQGLTLLSTVPLELASDIVSGVFFFSSHQGRPRLGVLVIGAEDAGGASEMASYQIESLQSPVVSKLGSVEFEGRRVLYSWAVGPSNSNLIACLYSNNTIARFDPSTFAIEQSGTFNNSRYIYGYERWIVCCVEGGVDFGLFDLNSLSMSSLVRTSLTRSNILDATFSAFCVCNSGDYVIGIHHLPRGQEAHHLPHYSVYSIDGAVDSELFARKLLNNAAQYSLTVADAWTFRLYICNSHDAAKDFTSQLIFIASELGKASHLSNLCRILHFVSRFCPMLSPGSFSFFLLNDLDRVISVCSSLTGHSERIVPIIDDVVNGKVSAENVGLGPFMIPEDCYLDNLLSVCPLVIHQLAVLNELLSVDISDPTVSNKRLLFALSSYRRRVISLLLFGMAIRDQLATFLESCQNQVISSFLAKQQGDLSGLLEGLSELFPSFKLLANSLSHLRQHHENKGVFEHELSVSIICMLLTNDTNTSVASKDILSLISAALPSTSAGNAARPPAKDLDRIRCIPVAGRAALTCRTCRGKTAPYTASALFHARWNEHYGHRCCCGGEWL